MGLHSSAFNLPISTVPTLLSSLRDITYLSSEGINIDVNINDQVFCEEMDELVITATIAEGSRVISTLETNFADTIISFESISPGDYTCSVTVEDGTGPIETM